MTTILLVVVILAAGGQLADQVRVRQEEVILRKLPVEQAHDYYEVLKRRARMVRLLRAITLASLVLVLLAVRRRFFPPPPSPSPASAAAPAPRPRPTNTEMAKALAGQELTTYAARAGFDATTLELMAVPGDERFPWIFECRPRNGGPPRLRVYVDSAGAAQVHKIAE